MHTKKVATHAQQQKRVCKYLTMYGNCKYGAQCHFFHPPALVQETKGSTVAQNVQQKIMRPLASKRVINTGVDTRITINANTTEEFTMGKRKRMPIPAGTKPAIADQRSPKKMKNGNASQEITRPVPNVTLSKRPVHARLGSKHSPSGAESPSSPSSSPGSSSPSSAPSSPLQTMNRPPVRQLQTNNTSSTKQLVDTRTKQLLGSYVWDKSGAGIQSKDVDFSLNLCAGASSTDGRWELHRDSVVSPSPFAVASSLFGATPQPRRQRISLGGNFRFLPITAEDEKKNVYWIEMTKTKETKQEEGGMFSESITVPATIRVPYQIISSVGGKKVGILMNAFGQEQLILVKSM